MTSARAQGGLTLLEIMIAIAVLGIMMVLAWTTISSTAEARQTFGAIEERAHEVRVAMARVVADLEAAYISGNEDVSATDRRTLFMMQGGGDVPELRFTTLGHTPLWGDANESSQTMISYRALDQRDQTHWVRRESRRLSNEPWKDEPAELEILLRDVEKVKFEFWDWRDEAWKDEWNTTANDGARGRLPSRVRVTVEYKDARGDDRKMVTQARILMQEQLNFLAQ